MKQVKYADNGWLSLFAILGLVFIDFCFGFLFVFNSIPVAFRQREKSYGLQAGKIEVDENGE